MKNNNGVMLIASLVRINVHRPGKLLVFTLAGTIQQPRPTSFYLECMIPGSQADVVQEKLHQDHAYQVLGSLIQVERRGAETQASGDAPGGTATGAAQAGSAQAGSAQAGSAQASSAHTGNDQAAPDTARRYKHQIKTFDVVPIYRELDDVNYIPSSDGRHRRLADASAFCWVTGNLGRNSTVRAGEHGTIARNSMAVDEYLGKNSTTHWINLVAFDEIAESLGAGERGNRVAIFGTPISESYKIDDPTRPGEKITIQQTSVRVERMEFIGEMSTEPTSISQPQAETQASVDPPTPSVTPAVIPAVVAVVAVATPIIAPDPQLVRPDPEYLPPRPPKDPAYAGVPAAAPAFAVNVAAPLPASPDDLTGVGTPVLSTGPYSAAPLPVTSAPLSSAPLSSAPMLGAGDSGALNDDDEDALDDLDLVGEQEDPNGDDDGLPEDGLPEEDQDDLPDEDQDDLPDDD